MEVRRSSFYSTLDLVPQLEHYDSTLPHKQAKSRPSLVVLRRAFEVSFSCMGTTSRRVNVGLEQAVSVKVKVRKLKVRVKVKVRKLKLIL